MAVNDDRLWKRLDRIEDKLDKLIDRFVPWKTFIWTSGVIATIALGAYISR
jgi:hypothetical protein